MLDILDTPVGPIITDRKKRRNASKNGDTVGPYRLHDFFFVLCFAFGFSPDKILYLATRFFEIKKLPRDVVYNEATILKMVESFTNDFLVNNLKEIVYLMVQKVGSICLSRGRLAYASDASVNEWLKRLD